MSNDTEATHTVPDDATEYLVAPASFAQQRLWFLDRLKPNLTVYNVPAAWRVRGPLDVGDLQQALHAIMARHEVLRTTLESEEGEAVQIIAEHQRLPLEHHELVPGSDLDDRLRALVQHEAQRPFALARGPLVRVGLARITDDDHVFFLNMHHVIADLWSLGVIANELWELYGAFRDGRPPELPELPIQYADFAVWQRELLDSDRMNRQLDYWKRHLDGAPPSIDLHTDHPRPRTTGFRGGWQPIQLDDDQSNDLRRLGRQLDATMFMVVAALFNVMLHRYTGCDDLVVGYPTAGRNRTETEGLVGLFLNTLVMRTRLTPTMGFDAVVEQVRESVLEGHAHQDLPFERLVEVLAPQRDLARHPVFQVAYSFLGTDFDALRLPGLELEWIPYETRTSKFDLTLIFSESHDDACWGGFEYSRDLFEPETMERFVGYLETLLAGVAADSRAPIGTLPILPEHERERLAQWSTTGAAADEPTFVDVLARFDERVAAAPDAVAVRGGDKVLTFAELDERAERLAHRLRELGAGAAGFVGLLLERSPAMVVAMIGVARVGAACVPLDPGLPAARLELLFDETPMLLVVTDEHSAGQVPSNGPQTLLIDGDDERRAQETVARPVLSVGAQHPAYCIFTSGSTGTPRGVVGTRGGLAQLVSWHLNRFELGPEDRTTQVANMSFDACIWEVWSSLAAGASLHIVDDATRRSLPDLLAFLSEMKITQAFLPTPLAEAVLAHEQDDLSLRILSTGGDRLHRGAKADARFEFVNNYGPTEAAVVATSGAVPRGADGLPPIGRPIAGVRAYVLGSDGARLPVGAPGELCIGGEGLAWGYLGHPAGTAERFVPDPHAVRPGARMFRTGDVVRFGPEGRLEFIGRADDQVSLHGHRVELGEIESALGKHPAVRACVVSVLEHAGLKQLVAYVETDTPPDDAAVVWRDHLRERLPATMVPAAFVQMCALPMLPNGKVDRSGLPLPDRADFGAGDDFVAPRNDLERRVAAIWGELLGVDPIGVTDDFFALGGQSLLVIQLMNRIRAVVGVDLSVRDVFERRTIEQLCGYMEQLLRIARSSVVVRDEDGEELETGEI